MAKYNINEKAILTDSDGTRDLIAESLIYTGTLTVTNTRKALANDYITDYFTVPYVFQGSTSGYASGGYQPQTNIIEKWPFSSDTNSSDVGDLTLARGRHSGQSSNASGYNSGGLPSTNTIDKFPFSADGNATDVGDLTRSNQYITAGQSSPENGYAAGGAYTSNIIDKFPVSTDANATDVGDLTQGRYGAAGQSSTTNGYTSGGGVFPSSPPAQERNTIDKFPFSSDANATDVGDITQARKQVAGQSSSTHGYTSGGGDGYLKTVDKFTFASDANATDVGDLTAGGLRTAGQSSTTHGYASGGLSSPPVNNNVIDKYSFSVDANATDVGDLTLARWDPTGNQV